MKKTELYENHIAFDAKMIDFAGYLMPVQYEGVVAEHNSVKNHDITEWSILCSTHM